MSAALPPPKKKKTTKNKKNNKKNSKNNKKKTTVTTTSANAAARSRLDRLATIRQKQRNAINESINPPHESTGLCVEMVPVASSAEVSLSVGRSGKVARDDEATRSASTATRQTRSPLSTRTAVMLCAICAVLTIVSVA